MAINGWHRWRAAGPDSTTALAADVVLGVSFAAVILAERAIRGILAPGSVTLVVSALLVGAGLALRRRVPLLAFLIGSAGLMADALATVPSMAAPYANLIGAYSVGLYATRRRAWWGLLAIVVGVGLYFWADNDPRRQPAGVLLLWVLAWTIAYNSARRRDEQATARRLMREQAVADERVRIARELHDLIGHTVNVMLVQAGAARRVLPRDPDQTRDLLTGLEHTGREALGELDRVLGVMRRDDLGDGVAGLPGVADLPDLAQQMTRAGLRVTVHMGPELPGLAGLPRSLDLSAYRIVQEGLTNALKHGGAGSATVTVRRGQNLGRDGLDIEISDDGRGAPPGYTSGRGLLGVRERVALFGGRVEHGPGPGGGFRVTAHLPVPDGGAAP